MNEYHYTESGLDNILIAANFVDKDDQGEDIITIPAIGQLHQLIAQVLIDQIGGLSGTEIKFLRTEMGMTQAELANILHRDTQTIGRWERSEVELDPIHDIIMRQLAAETLELSLNQNIEDQSKRVIPTAHKHPIKLKITGNADRPYELVA